LTAILELDTDRITCQGRIPQDSPFAFGPRAPSFLAVELAAQAAALLELSGRPLPGDPLEARSGYLVRIRRAQFATPVLGVEQPMVVRATRTGAAPPLSSYTVEVSANETRVFSGQLSTYANKT
jgi:hypothetical protein